MREMRSIGSSTIRTLWRSALEPIYEGKGNSVQMFNKIMLPPIQGGVGLIFYTYESDNQKDKEPARYDKLKNDKLKKNIHSLACHISFSFVMTLTRSQS